MWKKLIASVIVIGFFSGCVYTDSALQYAKEGTNRVQSGYDAKAEMTKHLTEYLAIQNKDCGVKVEIINNTPVTSVKECVRIDDALRDMFYGTGGTFKGTPAINTTYYTENTPV